MVKMEKSMKFGFVKVGAYTPQIKVGDIEFNSKNIIEGVELAEREKVEVLVFPELCITGSTCGHLYMFDTLLYGALNSLSEIVESTKSRDMIIFVGLPVKNNGKIYNVCAVISKGKILGIVPKTNVGEYFSKSSREIESINILGKDLPFSSSLIFNDTKFSGLRIGVEIGDDLFLPISNATILSQKGANLIVNLSSFSSNLRTEKQVKQELVSITRKLNIGYVLSNCGEGESTTDCVYSGHNFIAEEGEIIKESCSFSKGLITEEINVDFIKKNTLDFISASAKFIDFDVNSMQNLTRKFDKTPFIPKCREDYKKILEIQAEGLKKRVVHTGAKSLIVGLSGGLDSTLALLVCVRTMQKLDRDLKEIIAVTMPCFGTTSRTLENSIKLAKTLGVSLKKIEITKSVVRHLKDIEHSGKAFDAAYENAQARERTQVLMDLANMKGGIVVGTGDMSELALGWATYNGDHMSMYGVNCGVTKTLVKFIVSEYAKDSKIKLRSILNDILDTPVSPELIPTDEKDSKQKTEDIVGPYVLHDFFLYNMIFKGLRADKVYYMARSTFEEFDSQTILKWLNTFIRRFFSQQFKRSCLPDGVAVDEYSLSPRRGFSMPSDAVGNMWIEQIKNI